MKRTVQKPAAAGARTGLGAHPQSPLVSLPGDAQEQVAEHVADSVVTGRACPAIQSLAGGASLQRAGGDAGVSPHARAQAATATQSGGRPLARTERTFFEHRFGRDLGHVRLHTGGAAADAARGINAHAFTHRNHIAFANGAYQPDSHAGRHLLAHELTHTLQQAGNGPSRIQRACTPSAVCNAPSIPGNPEDFGVSEEAREAGARTRRRGMGVVRARSSGHAGKAGQLEKVLRDHSASQMGLLHGIFLDADLSDTTGAMVGACDAWRDDSLPAGDPDPHGMDTATKPCMFVPGALNRQALRFNTGRATVGGEPRAEWHADTLRTLIHEAEHVRFDDHVEPGLPLPGAVTSASCTKAAVDDPLSEIVAIVSEFKVLSDAAAGEADASGPLHTSLSAYFSVAVSQPGENFRGALTAMGCSCDCAEVDALLVQSVDAMTSAWSAAEKTRFRTEIQALMPTGSRPSWPDAPSP